MQVRPEYNGFVKNEWVNSCVARVRTTVSSGSLFAGSQRVLVMVSGGQDSVALLEILAGGLLGESGPGEVHALHVNHHLRGEESDADQSLVETHCSRLGAALTVVHKPIEKAAGNVQERARVERRRAALQVAADERCDCIALGHTADDQAENLLYRMGRYGGVAALRGMLPVDPPWVRPLLGLRRAETELFCRERDLVFAVDRGNFYPGYVRTGLRERVLPAWETVLEGAVEGAARTAEVAAEAESLLRAEVASTRLDLGAEQLQVPRLAVMSQGLRRLALRSWLEQHGVLASRATVLAVERLLERNGSAACDVGGGHRVLRLYDVLMLSGQDDARAQERKRGGSSRPPVSPAVTLPVPGSAEWDDAVVEAEVVEHFFAPDVRREAYVDAGSLTGPVIVRGQMPGDRVHLLGAPGLRKLQDVLVDMRVPAAMRRRVPLVVAGDDIVWVCGLALCEKSRITADTAQIVRLGLREAGVRPG